MSMIFNITITTECTFEYVVQTTDRVAARQEAIRQHDERLRDERLEHLMTNVLVECIEER